MSELNYGNVGILLNLDLLSKTNIDKYLSNDLLGILNNNYVEKHIPNIEEHVQTPYINLDYTCYKCGFKNAIIKFRTSSGDVITIHSKFVDYGGRPKTKCIALINENKDSKLYLNSNNEFAIKGKFFSIKNKDRQLVKLSYDKNKHLLERC